MGKTKKEEKTYIKIDRKCGMTLFRCELCDADLNEIIIEHLEEIIVAKLEVKLYCPNCKRRLDFGKLVIKTEIVPKKQN